MSIFEFPEREFTYEQVEDRGRRAAELLSDPVLMEAFESAERAFVQEWHDSVDRDTRDAAWAKVHALEAVQRMLRAIRDDGEQAKAVRTKRELLKQTRGQ